MSSDDQTFAGITLLWIVTHDTDGCEDSYFSFTHDDTVVTRLVGVFTDAVQVERALLRVNDSPLVLDAWTEIVPTNTLLNKARYLKTLSDSDVEQA